jgi:hypothetical protein
MADILRENIHESMEKAKKLLDDTAAEEDTAKLSAVTAGLLRGMLPVFQDMLKRIEELESKVESFDGRIKALEHFRRCGI